MCYLIAKRFNESGSIALKTTRGKELANFADKFQEKIGYDIQLVTITRPSAYGEYEPYHFANSYEEFEKEVNLKDKQEQYLKHHWGSLLILISHIVYLEKRQNYRFCLF